MKVLNIGLPRTGTYSLHIALKILGYKSVHYPQHIEIIKDFDAAAEVRFDYRLLENLYPNSLYIYTIRNKRDWLRSCHAHKIHKKFGWNPFWEHETRWQEIYEEKQKSIDFFYNFKHRLLIMNVCKGDGWQSLCNFLGKDCPTIPFPYTNQSSSKHNLL